VGKVTKFGHFGQTYVLFQKDWPELGLNQPIKIKKDLKNQSIMIFSVFFIKSTNFNAVKRMKR